MSQHCCASENLAAPTDPVFKRVLWFALVVNALMFLVEIIASEISQSVALKADALDFFGDAANYAISLLVVTSSLTVRAKASIVKALTMLAFGAFILLSTTLRSVNGDVPAAQTMGLIGFLALSANVAVAFALYQFRGGDSNMQSVWLCSRNDAIGNVAVIFAGAAVFISHTRWPDLIVAAIMASLAISSAWQILQRARAELQETKHEQNFSNITRHHEHH